jgi:hypothetical protein
MYSLHDDPAQRLRRYNRCADGAGYREQVEEVRRLWIHRREELTAENEADQQEILKIEEQLRQAVAEHRMRGDLQKRAKQDLNHLEAELHVAKRRWNRRLSTRDALVARTSFFMMALFALLVLFADLLPVDPSTRNLLRTAGLVLTLMFLGIFSLMVGRILYMRSKRQEHEALREDVISLEGRLLNKQYEYHDLAARAGRTEAEGESLHQRIDMLKHEIRKRQRQLELPYV